MDQAIEPSAFPGPDYDRTMLGAVDWEGLGVLAAVLFGFSGLVLSILTYRQQVRSERRTETELARTSAALGDAQLEVELRPEASSSVMLVVRNLGPHEARNVAIEGKLDTGGYQALREFPHIAPGSQQALIVPQPGYYIIAGNSHFDVQLAWEDGHGPHPPEHRVATRVIPYDP